VNKTSNTVALHEPIQPKLVPVNNDDAVLFIQEFFDQQRDLILNRRIARSCSISGQVPDNHVGDIDFETGKRSVLLDGDTLKIDKKLEHNFSLLIKQPGLFTAMLETLNSYFQCYATIRNPLAVLRSWNSVDMAVTNGHAPAAENYDINLKKKLAKEEDVYNRQLLLLSWYFEQYFLNLNENKIIRYEEVISSGGICLKSIDLSASKLNVIALV